MAESGRESAWADHHLMLVLPPSNASLWQPGQETIAAPALEHRGKEQNDQHQNPLSEQSAIHTLIPQSPSLLGRAVHEHPGEPEPLLPSHQATGALTSPAEGSGQG